MKILKWVLILIVLIPTVVVAGFFVRNKIIGPTGWAEDNTENALRAKMKDPDSMKILSSYVVAETGSDGDTNISICGIVDAKNLFGVYTGGTRFVSESLSSKKFGTFNTYKVEMEDSAQKSEASSVNRLSAFEEVYWNVHCVDETHPPITVAPATN